MIVRKRSAHVPVYPPCAPFHGEATMSNWPTRAAVTCDGAHIHLTLYSVVGGGCEGVCEVDAGTAAQLALDLLAASIRMRHVSTQRSRPPAPDEERPRPVAAGARAIIDDPIFPSIEGPE